MQLGWGWFHLFETINVRNSINLRAWEILRIFSLRMQHWKSDAPIFCWWSWWNWYFLWISNSFLAETLSGIDILSLLNLYIGHGFTIKSISKLLNVRYLTCVLNKDLIDLFNSVLLEVDIKNISHNSFVQQGKEFSNHFIPLLKICCCLKYSKRILRYSFFILKCLLKHPSWLYFGQNKSFYFCLCKFLTCFDQSVSHDQSVDI